MLAASDFKGREVLLLKLSFQERGKSFAVTRLAGILLSLSVVTVFAYLVFSVQGAYDYCIKSRSENETAQAVCAEMQDAVAALGDYLSQQAKDESADPKSVKGTKKPSALHLGVGKNYGVTLIADGKKQKFSVNSGTVGDLLEEAGLTVGENDRLSHKTDSILKKGMTVRLQRVTFGLRTERVSVDYKTKKKKNSEMYLGEMYLESEGKNGEREDTYIDILVDGAVEKSKRILSKTLKNAVDEVIQTGTKKRVVKKGAVGVNGYNGLSAFSELPAKVKFELDENGKPTEYKQKIVGSATAYYGGGITATGQTAMPGRVAVDPREIPYGSKLYIVSCDGRFVYGYCEASDTGGFIYNSPTVVDLYFHTFAECSAFGRRNVEIYVLE